MAETLGNSNQLAGEIQKYEDAASRAELAATQARASALRYSNVPGNAEIVSLFNDAAGLFDSSAAWYREAAKALLSGDTGGATQFGVSAKNAMTGANAKVALATDKIDEEGFEDETKPGVPPPTQVTKESQTSKTTIPVTKETETTMEWTTVPETSYTAMTEVPSTWVDQPPAGARQGQAWNMLFVAGVAVALGAMIKRGIEKAIARRRNAKAVDGPSEIESSPEE